MFVSRQSGRGLRHAVGRMELMNLLKLKIMDRIIRYLCVFCFLSVAVGCSSDDKFSDIVISPSEEVKPQVVKVFSHPGILFNYEDMARIRKQAFYYAKPWSLGYDLLAANTNVNYVVQGPYAEVERTEGVNSTAAGALSGDAQMAYHCAVMWFVSDDRRYADKAIEILNSWSGTLKRFTGGDDMLMAAWYGFNLINAAEILRYTDSGWEEEDIAQAESMFRDVFYELIKDWKRGRAGNWDTAITKMHLAVGVFLDDKEIFDRAIAFYKSETEGSNGTLVKNIYESGQNFESGRDQTHAHYGIGGLAEACEVAWKQKEIDPSYGELYGYKDNRLLKGFEYTAKYNLGNDDVPYESNVYGSVISSTDRGKFQPIYELVYNHFANRVNVPDEQIAYTKQVVDKIRSEGGESFNAQCLGLGTLVYNLAE